MAEPKLLQTQASSQRVLVCGGRHYSDRRTLFNALDELNSRATITAIICGGATGADSLALEWARARGIKSHTYLAFWKIHGHKAGPLRNARMLSDSKPDIVLAFPGGFGTLDMVRRAERIHVPVLFA